MGANAQTSVPTFTAGEVLTAANMNISARTGVPVFADTTARDAAFGGTGEKTLAEGQLCYVENLTGVEQLQYYDGAAWVSLTGGGLVYLTGTTFTTATSFSLPNDTFTSTYRNYRMFVNITGVTSDSDFTLRLRTSGSDNTNASYQFAFLGLNASAGTANNASSTTGTSFNVGESDANGYYSLVIDIMNPQVASHTNIAATYNMTRKDGADMIVRTGGGVFNGTTVFDAVSFISSVASSITGIYRVYGYANS